MCVFLFWLFLICWLFLFAQLIIIQCTMLDIQCFELVSSELYFTDLFTTKMSQLRAKATLSTHSFGMSRSFRFNNYWAARKTTQMTPSTQKHFSLISWLATKKAWSFIHRNLCAIPWIDASFLVIVAGSITMQIFRFAQVVRFSSGARWFHTFFVRMDGWMDGVSLFVKVRIKTPSLILRTNKTNNKIQSEEWTLNEKDNNQIDESIQWSWEIVEVLCVSLKMEPSHSPWMIIHFDLNNLYSFHFIRYLHSIILLFVVVWTARSWMKCLLFSFCFVCSFTAAAAAAAAPTTEYANRTCLPINFYKYIQNRLFARQKRRHCMSVINVTPSIANRLVLRCFFFLFILFSYFIFGKQVYY